MSKEDLELEELEKQFLEDLNSKPKPKKTTVIDVNKFNQEFDKDFEELNKREGKINNSFEKNNYDNKFLDKLEKHLKDTPPKHIEFYNKLKYRGNNVIGINFKAEKKGQYSRKKIEEIAYDLSHYLHEENVRGIMSNAMLISIRLEKWITFTPIQIPCTLYIIYHIYYTLTLTLTNLL